MDNKEFLQTYPKEWVLPPKCAGALKLIIEEANQSYVIESQIQPDWTDHDGVQWYKITVCCPRTNFADAYAHLGMLYGQKVLPLWEAHFKNKSKTRNPRTTGK